MSPLKQKELMNEILKKQRELNQLIVELLKSIEGCCKEISEISLENLSEPTSLEELTKLECPQRNSKEVEDMLDMTGIPRYVTGYQYLKEAIQRVKDNRKECSYGGVTKWLYPEIAKKFETTPSRVERSIRYAIEVAWNRMDPDDIFKLFGNSINPEVGKPTNSQFIITLMEKLA